MVNRLEHHEEFTQFVRTHMDALSRTAWLLTGDRAAAEDLVQTALLKTYMRWGRLDRGPELAGYVRKIMVSEIQSRRRRKSSQEMPSEFLPDRGHPDQSDRVVERDRVISVLKRLPPGQRAVVVLRYYEDRSERQTADILGCSIGNVKSQAARGLKTLATGLSAPNFSERQI